MKLSIQQYSGDGFPHTIPIDWDLNCNFRIGKYCKPKLLFSIQKANKNIQEQFYFAMQANVDSAGNKINLPDLPVGIDSLEYLVDRKTKEHLTELYHNQIVELRHFRDKIRQHKQKEWLNILVSIVNENGILFNSLLEPICGINEQTIQYTEALANEKLVDGFDINVHNDIKQIFDFAVQYHVVVEESFLCANQNASNILEQYKEIGYLDEAQLFTLEANMETLKNVVDDNVSFAKGAVNKLKHTMNNFVEFTKKLANILHKLQLTIQLKIKNVKRHRETVMIELKQQLAVCLKEMSKLDVQNVIEQNIVGIKEEMKYAENSVFYLFKDIEDAILRREPENIVANSEVKLVPEHLATQNVPQMKLDLPLPNLKLLTIKTQKSRVKELIDYFNQYANIVTPRQLINLAKKDVVLMDLLKRDQINITFDERQLVKSKIGKFEACKIPKPTKGNKVAACSSKKPPKK